MKLPVPDFPSFFCLKNEHVHFRFLVVTPFLLAFFEGIGFLRDCRSNRKRDVFGCKKLVGNLEGILLVFGLVPKGVQLMMI